METNVQNQKCRKKPASRVYRTLQVLTIIQSGQKCGPDDLAQILNISKRTLLRDLKELKKVGISYKYSSKDYSYKLDPCFFYRSMNLTLEEAETLFMLAYKARNHINYPFKDFILQAALKIENSLSKATKQYCSAVLQNIFLKSEPQVRTALLDKLFVMLQEAMIKKRIVSFNYHHTDGRQINTDLHPYHLIYSDYAWHVIGKSSFYKDIYTFRLNRIKTLKVLDKCFVEKKRFDIHKYLDKAWLLKQEGKLYKVKLRFLPEVAEDVAEVQWHSTQAVTRNSDGSVILDFQIDGLNEITWWILRYGGQVQVIAPKVLRKRIIKIANNMMSTYNIL